MLNDDTTSAFCVSWLIFITLILLFLYKLVFQYWNYFDRNDVKFIRGWPFLGTQYDFLLGKISSPDSFADIYNAYPNESVVGMYSIGGQPVYVIRDIEMIKKITTSDFDHFVNHRFHVEQKSDPLIGRSMFAAQNQQWKDVRATVSPAFTGSKMRLMLQLVRECSIEVCEHIASEMTNGMLTMNFKDLASRFVANSVATCAFGFKVDTLKVKDHEFYQRGYSAANLSAIKFFAFSSIPKLMNFFKVKMLRREDVYYFRRMIRTNMQYRIDNNVHRPDMINLMIEARNGLLKHDTQDDDIEFAAVKESELGKSSKNISNFVEDDFVAQCMIFIFGGFNSAPTSQSFMAYALAVYPDVQDKLYAEVKSVFDRLSGKQLTYEDLQAMRYMDMFVSEILRKWPFPAMDRIVNKEYILSDNSGKKIQLNVGDSICIPLSGLHMDAKYFERPESFEPERFSDENKKNIVRGAYMPFGSGPRNCVASRFALMQMKTLFFYLVLNFRFEKCSRTVHPIQLKKNVPFLDAEDGFWIQLKARDNDQ